MTATVLYTPEVLGLAVELVRYPLTDDLPLRAGARSRSCGSTLELGLALAADGTIERLGLRCQACAIGQAAAAIFAAAAHGRSAGEIAAAGEGLRAWLDGDGAMPDWPGLETIAAARDYPARHGAVTLPWTAATEALSTA